jgi:hypothetical protein
VDVTGPFTFYAGAGFTVVVAFGLALRWRRRHAWEDLMPPHHQTRVTR